MFKCAYCHKSYTIHRIKKDAGDYVARCSACGAKNLLKVAQVNSLLVPMIEIAGWRN